MSTIYSQIKTSGYIGSDLEINNLTFDSDLSTANEQEAYVAIIKPSNYLSPPSALHHIALNGLPSSANMILPTSISGLETIQPISSNSWGSYNTIFPNGFVMLNLDETQQNESYISYTLNNTSNIAFNLSLSSGISTILLFSNPSKSESNKIKCSYQITGQSPVIIKAASTSVTPNVYNSNIAGSIPAGGSIVFKLENTGFPLSNANPYLFVTLTGVTYTSADIYFTTTSPQSVTYQTQNSFVPVIKATPNLLHYTLDGALVTFNVLNSSDVIQTTKTGTFANFSASPTNLLTYGQFIPGTYYISASYSYNSAYPNYTSSTLTALTLIITGDTLSPVLTIPATVNFTDTLNFTYLISSPDEILGALTLTIADNLAPPGTKVYTTPTIPYTSVTDPNNPSNKLVTYSTSGLGLTAKSLNTTVAAQMGNPIGNGDTFPYLEQNFIFFYQGPGPTMFIGLDRTLAGVRVDTEYKFLNVGSYIEINCPLNSEFQIIIFSLPYYTQYNCIICTNYSYSSTCIWQFSPQGDFYLLSSIPSQTGINTIPSAINNYSVKANFVPTNSTNYYTPTDITKTFKVNPVKLQVTVTPSLTNSNNNSQYNSAINLTAIPYENGVSFSSVMVSTASAVFSIYNASTNALVTTLTTTFDTGSVQSFHTSISSLALGTYYVVAAMATDANSQKFSYIISSDNSSSFTVDQAVTTLTIDSPNESGVYDLPLNVTGMLTGAQSYGANGTFELYATDVNGSNRTVIYNTIPVGTTNGSIMLGTELNNHFTLHLTPSSIGVTSDPLQLYHFVLEWTKSDATYTTSSAVFTIRGIPDTVATTLACDNYVSGTSTVEDVLNFTMTVGSSSDNSQDANTGLVTVFYTTTLNPTPVQLTSQTITNNGTGSPPTFPFTFKAVRDNQTSNPNLVYTFYATYQPQNSDGSTNTNFLKSTSTSVTNIQLIKALTSFKSHSLVSTTTSANTVTLTSVSATVPINDVVNVATNVLTTDQNVVPGNVLIQYKYSTQSSYTTLFSSAVDGSGNYLSTNFTFNALNMPTGLLYIQATFTPSDSVNYANSSATILFTVTSTVIHTTTATFTNSSYSYLQDMSLIVNVTPFTDSNGSFISTSGRFKLLNGTTELYNSTNVLTFNDDSTPQTIALTATPKTYNLSVNDTPYSLTVVFTPSNTNISATSIFVLVTVTKQPLTFALTTPTATTFLYGQNIPVTVTATNSLNSNNNPNSTPIINATVIITTTVDNVTYTLGTGTFTNSTTVSVTANLYNKLDLAQDGTVLTLTAVVTSTDNNYQSSVSQNVTSTNVTINSVSITLSSLSINNEVQSFTSNIFSNGLSVYNGTTFNISGQLAVNSASIAFVNSGTIQLQTIINNVTIVYKTLIINSNGSFTADVPCSTLNTNPYTGINKSGYFYLYYIPQNGNYNFINTSLKRSTTQTPGLYFITLETLPYSLTMTGGVDGEHATGSHSDYKDGHFKFTTTMTLSENGITASPVDIVQNSAIGQKMPMGNSWTFTNTSNQSLRINITISANDVLIPNLMTSTPLCFTGATDNFLTVASGESFSITWNVDTTFRKNINFWVYDLYSNTIPPFYTRINLDENNIISNLIDQMFVPDQQSSLSSLSNSLFFSNFSCVYTPSTNVITDVMLQNLAQGDGLFSFAIYNENGNVYSPAATSITTLNASGLSSISTTFTFNPLAINLSAGTYNIASQFSGINAVFDNETAKCNSNTTFLTFTVDKTVPIINMSVLLNPKDNTTGVNGTTLINSNGEISYYYRQQPYVCLKIQSPVSITSTYNSANDIPGVTNLTTTKNNTGRYNIAFNDVAGNGILTNYVSSFVHTNIRNIINTKVIQFRLEDAGVFTLFPEFTPDDQINYEITSNFRFKITINPYKPVIDNIINPPYIDIVNETTQAGNLDPSTIPKSNEINYDESFKITNKLNQFDNTIVNYTSNDGITYTANAVDYDTIDGTIGLSYTENGSSSNSNLSTGDRLPVGSTFSILFNQTANLNYYVVNSTGIAYNFNNIILLGNIKRQYTSGEVLTIVLDSNLVPNFDGLVITIQSEQNTISQCQFNLSNSVFIYDKVNIYMFATLYRGNPPLQGTLTLANGNLTSITSFNDNLRWETIVKPQQIPKNDTDGYTLKLTFLPSSSNFVNSDQVSVPVFMTIANALGTFTLLATTPQYPNGGDYVIYNYSSTSANGVGIKLSGTITFIGSPAVNDTTGTVSFYYRNQSPVYVKMLATASVSSQSTLSQNFSVMTTELNATQSPYSITAKFTPNSSNYPIITQGSAVSVQVNPLLTLSFTNGTDSVPYQSGAEIHAVIYTGADAYDGSEDEVTFTFTPTSTALQTFTYKTHFLPNTGNSGGGYVTFNSINVSSIENPGKGLYNDLVRGTYNITCVAQFQTSQKFNQTVQNNTIVLIVNEQQIPFNLSIDKSVICYKEATQSLPIYTATFNIPIIGSSGTDVYLRWTLTGVNNTYHYTQFLKNSDYKTIFSFQQPEDLPVDNYTITCAITSPNYGTYNSGNSKYLAVNKNNDIIINPATVQSYYKTTNITVSLLLNNNDTVTDGNVQFLLLDSNTLINTSANGSGGYTAIFAIPTAGTHRVGIYFMGNSSYNASPIVTTNIVVEKITNISTSPITLNNYSTSETDYKLTLNIPGTFGLSDIFVYTDLSQAPIIHYLDTTTTNSVQISDTLLQKGSNGNNLYVFVSNNNVITSFPVFNFVVPQINIATINVYPSVTSTEYNTSVTFDVTVSSAKGLTDIVNEGEIIFVLNGTSVIQYVAVNNNAASASFIMLDLGSNTITAQYVNSVNYADSAASTFCYVDVTRNDITLTLTKNNVTTITKQAMLTATLTTPNSIDSINDSYVNDGYITFTTVDLSNNSIVLFDNVPIKNSVVNVPLFLAPNTNYNITATFSGNTQYSSVASNSVVINPSLGTIVTDYKSVTFTVVDSNIGSGFLTATATVTPVNDTYFYKNSGDVVFSMNGVFVSVPLSNGTASVTFEINSFYQTPTVVYQNLDYYSNMLTGSVYTEQPALLDFASDLLVYTQSYTIYNNDPNPVPLDVSFQWTPRLGRVTIQGYGFWTFSLEIIGHTYDDYIEFSHLGDTAPYSGNFRFTKNYLSQNQNRTGRFANGGSLVIYKGMVTSVPSSSSTPVATPLALPTPYDLKTTQGVESVQLSFQSEGKYFDISSSPSVTINNPVKATSISSTKKSITINGLTEAITYTFTAVATDFTRQNFYTNPFTFPAITPIGTLTTNVVSSLPGDVNVISSTSSISSTNLNNIYFKAGSTMNFTITGLTFNSNTINYSIQPANMNDQDIVRLSLPKISKGTNISVVNININTGILLTLTLSADGTTINATDIPNQTIGIFYFN